MPPDAIVNMMDTPAESSAVPNAPLMQLGLADQTGQPDYGMWDQLIKVIVGPKEKTFRAHRHILTSIPFFETCLRQPMTESARGEVWLQEADPSIFATMLNFAYTGVVDLFAEIERVELLPSENVREQVQAMMIRMAETYMTAKMYAYEPLGEALRRSLNCYIGVYGLTTELLSCIVPNTFPGDNLRGNILSELAKPLLQPGKAKCNWDYMSVYKEFVLASPENGLILVDAMAEHVNTKEHIETMEKHALVVCQRAAKAPLQKRQRKV